MKTNILTLTSLFVLYLHQPSLTQKKPSFLTNRLLSPSPSIIAHRCGCMEGRENSLSALQQAVSLGVDLIQIDVRKTKDDKFILMADEKLTRLTGQEENVSDIVYEDIQPFLNTIETPFGVFTQENLENEKPGKIDDVIIFVSESDVGILLYDWNDTSKGTVQMLKAFQKAGLLERVILKTKTKKELLTSIFGERLKFVTEEEELNSLYTSFFEGSLKEEETLNEIDVFSSSLDFKEFEIENQQKVYSALKEKKTEVKIMNAYLRNQNIPVVYQGINEVRDYKDAMRLGANAIMTARPAKFEILINIFSH